MSLQTPHNTRQYPVYQQSIHLVCLDELENTFPAKKQAHPISMKLPLLWLHVEMHSYTRQAAVID